MPLHDVACPNCRTVLRDVFVKNEELPLCNECGTRTAYHFETAKIQFFHEGWYEHIDSEPIYIRSRRQLLEETRRRGKTCPYAEGGFFGAGNLADETR